MKSKRLVSLLVLSLTVTWANSQTPSQDTTYKKFFAGSTLFVLANFIPGDPNPPDFVQLNFGWRIRPKDAVSLEAKTWKYGVFLA